MADVEDIVGEEMNIRIEVQNESFSAELHDYEEVEEEDGEMETEEVKGSTSTVTHVIGKVTQEGLLPSGSGGVEDGECSSLSASVGSDMEVDTGGMADAESSPMYRGSKPKFERSLSKFVTPEGRGDGDSDGGHGQGQPPPPRGPRQYPNPFCFGSEDAKKKAERAKRFNDTKYKFETEDGSSNVLQAQATLAAGIGDEELLSLYKSSGLFTEDWGEPSFDKVGAQYRLDSILLRGINNMSTEEIFAYLFDIGLVPQAMEWVNDACCIAVYKSKQEAAASLLKVTKPISVDHEVMEKKKNLEIEDKPIPEDDDDEKKAVEQEKKNTQSKAEGVLNYDEVSIIPYEQVAVPMPLGYVWRYAKPCEKAKGILMRFATIQDRKQERAERYSEYYKKHGNPNNPNYRPNEEGPRRKRPFKRVRYNPSPEVSSSEEEDLKEGQKFNVWTKLSADWHDEEDGGRNSNSHKQQRRNSNSNVRANTPIPYSTVSGPHSPSAAVFSRLSHTRRGHFEGPNESYPDPERSVFDKLDKNASRKRGRGWNNPFDDGGEKQFFTAGHDSDEEWTSRLKGPTMRMHADVEESRQKLQATRKLQHQSSKPSISSRLGGLGGRVEYVIERDHHEDDNEDISGPPPRMSVKDRLGVRRDPALFRSRDNQLEVADEYAEAVEVDEDEYLEALLHQDEDA